MSQLAKSALTSACCTQVYGGLQKAELAAAVLAGALVAVGDQLFAAHQLGNAVGQLELAAHGIGFFDCIGGASER